MKTTKMFCLTMVVSANADSTESTMMQRFESFLKALPKDVSRIIFQPDCCLVEMKVDEMNDEQ